MRFLTILILTLFDSPATQLIFANESCATPICLEAAANIQKNMNTNINPCDDFYEFACGNYIKENKIPDDKPFANVFTTVIREIEDQMITLISKPHHIRPFQLLKQLYDQCMNVNEIEKHGLTSLMQILKRLGHWPVLIGDIWKDNNFNWRESIYEIRKLGINLEAFLNIGVETDPSNSSRQIIFVDQPSLGLQQEILVDGLENKIVEAYFEYMVQVAVTLGANHTLAKRDIRESLDCEIQIAQISLSLEEWWNATALHNPMTIQELTKKYPGIPWMEYITNVLYITDFIIQPNDIVTIKVPTYLDKLEKLLKSVPKRVQANYILWRTIHHVIPFLTKDLRNKHFEFEQVQSGHAAQKPRSQECFDDLCDKMEIAMGALYARNYFSDDARNVVRSIVDDLLQAFGYILKNLHWTDEETSKHAVAKALSVTKYIGYPDEMLDDNALIKYYENLNLTFDDYLTTSLEISKFGWYEEYKNLRNPVNKTDWTSRLSPLVVNAVYSATENSIQVPAAILQNIFFHKDRPQYMNYAAIGNVIGHEITHGFDDFGKHYDKNGNLFDWWTHITEKSYAEEAQCFVEQYNNFSIPELQIQINGKRTLNENIADNGGIVAAYLAYRIWKYKFGPEKPLRGLNYTTDQLFWISAANVFCTHDRPEYVKLSALLNPHAPLRFRILGSFSNLPQFSSDFSCSISSKMNAQRCHLWQPYTEDCI